MNFTDKLRAAKEAAEKASKGESFIDGITSLDTEICLYNRKYKIKLRSYDYGQPEADANFIVKMSPSFTLELISRYEEAVVKLKEVP